MQCASDSTSEHPVGVGMKAAQADSTAGLTPMASQQGVEAAWDHDGVLLAERRTADAGVATEPSRGHAVSAALLAERRRKRSTRGQEKQAPIEWTQEKAFESIKDWKRVAEAWIQASGTTLPRQQQARTHLYSVLAPASMDAKDLRTVCKVCALSTADVDAVRGLARQAHAYLFKTHLRLAHHSVRQAMKTRNYDAAATDDALTTAHATLAEAIWLYDPTMDTCFSTYAFPRIYWKLHRQLLEQGHVVKQSIGYLTMQPKIVDALATLYGMAGAELHEVQLSEAQVTAVAEHIGASPKSVRNALATQVQQSYMSGLPVDIVDAVAADSSEADDAAIDAEMSLIMRDLGADLDAMLHLLPEGDATLLRMRYGVGGVPPRSIRQIGAELGIARPGSVHHKLKTAMAKLSRQSRAYLAALYQDDLVGAPAAAN